MTVTSLLTPRVGHIDFLNCYPLQWALERGDALDAIELVPSPPAQLSDSLIGGGLAISPITLVEYLRHSDELYLLPNLAVAADGPVLSCNLVSSRPLDELDGRRVGLGSTSRTTVVLAQLLLEELFGVQPQYFPSDPDVDFMLAHGDAGVIIGDPGLRSYFHRGHLDGFHVHDTAKLWKDWTGLPMVFAVWAVRREFADDHPRTVAHIHRTLTTAFDTAGRSLDTVARACSRRSGFTTDELSTYFRSLSYALTPAALQGIRRFSNLAAMRGEVPARQPLTVFDG